MLSGRHVDGEIDWIIKNGYMCNIKLEYNYLVVSYRIYFILYNAKKKMCGATRL